MSRNCWVFNGIITTLVTLFYTLTAKLLFPFKIAQFSRHYIARCLCWRMQRLDTWHMTNRRDTVAASVITRSTMKNLTTASFRLPRWTRYRWPSEGAQIHKCLDARTQGWTVRETSVSNTVLRISGGRLLPDSRDAVTEEARSTVHQPTHRQERRWYRVADI